MAFTIIVGALCALMVIGMPIAFAFLAVNIAGAYFFWGGVAGLNQMVLAVMDSVASFSIMPVPLFLLMGEILFRAGLAARLMDVLDAWLGRVPGRLSLMAVAGGTLFATLAGSGAATTALLGRILVPDMVKRGYKQPMTLGPVMGSGGLAVMLPPSALGVILAATANLSVGEFLLAIIVPGLMMAASYAIYVVVRCTLQPDIAPIYSGGPKQPLNDEVHDAGHGRGRVSGLRGADGRWPCPAGQHGRRRGGCAELPLRHRPDRRAGRSRAGSWPVRGPVRRHVGA